MLGEQAAAAAARGTFVTAMVAGDFPSMGLTFWSVSLAEFESLPILCCARHEQGNFSYWNQAVGRRGLSVNVWPKVFDLLVVR